MKKLNKKQNPYIMGYFLHAYLPPKVIKKIAAAYDKAKIEAVLVPSHNDSWPSIWGVDVKHYNRKISAIYKKFKTAITLEQRAEFMKIKRGIR